jgi:cbb3-type cytochrome oxidase maturation protein
MAGIGMSASSLFVVLNALRLQRRLSAEVAHGKPLLAHSAVVVLVFVIGVIFWWSVRSGQFDDLEGPGYRVVATMTLRRPASLRSRESESAGMTNRNSPF